MSNNPLLHYKPGLTLDAPIAVTIAAADWLALMTWANQVDTDGVNHIWWGVIAPQISDAVFTPASVQAAKAHHGEYGGINGVLRQMGMPVPGDIKPEDFAPNQEIWVVECGECGSRDEYTPYQAHGVLTCEHNGNRSLLEVKVNPTDEE
jgi:hypothetical protein